MTAFDPSTALLVIDVQNDFADPAGSLYVQGGENVVAFANAEIERATGAGSPVFYSQDWHPPTTPHFARDGGIWPVHCVAGTWGADLHPELSVVGDVVRKGTSGEDGYSAFTMRDPTDGQETSTGLGDLLAAAGVTRLVVCGLATDYCVRSTVLDARQRGFPTTVLDDGIRAVDVQAGDGDRAVEEMLAAGARLESRGVAAAARSAEPPGAAGTD